MVLIRLYVRGIEVYKIISLITSIYFVFQAIYENMLVEIPFASFFLSKILSRHSGDLDIHHLASLDPEMYKYVLNTCYNYFGGHPGGFKLIML